MVASQHHTADTADGNPAGSLQGLCRLVDKDGAELLAVQQAVGTSHEGAGNDAGFAEELGIDTYLQFVGAVFQAIHLLVVSLPPSLPRGAPQLTDGFADGPQQFVVGVGLEAALVGERQHLVVHARGITYS